MKDNDSLLEYKDKGRFGDRWEDIKISEREGVFGDYDEYKRRVKGVKEGGKKT